MGGWSAEREVSLDSGKACAKALRDAGFQVTPIDAKRDIAEVLAAPQARCRLQCAAWQVGRGRLLSAILETLQIPYTHSGVLASALAMHKENAKAIFRGAGMPVAEQPGGRLEIAARAIVMNLPYVLKPVDEGSSVGVHIVDGGANTAAAASFSSSARSMARRSWPSASFPAAN